MRDCYPPDRVRNAESKLRFSRLTGAGWGGCIVALLSTDKVSDFLEGMKADYYQDLEAAKALSNSSAYIFPSQPGSGARIYRVEGSG